MKSTTSSDTSVVLKQAQTLYSNIYKQLLSLLCFSRHTLRADLLQDTLKIDALGTFDRQTQCPIPDELCEGSETTADTEGGRIVERLLEAEVVEEDTGRRVDVRERVLGLLGGSAAASMLG